MVNRNKPLSEKASDAVQEVKDQAQVRGRAVSEHLKQDQRGDRTAQDIKDDLSKDKNEVRAEGTLTSVQNAASQAWEATKETVNKYVSHKCMVTSCLVHGRQPRTCWAPMPVTLPVLLLLQVANKHIYRMPANMLYSTFCSNEDV